MVEDVITVRRAETRWTEQWVVPAIRDQPRLDSDRGFQSQGRALFDFYRSAQAELNAHVRRDVDAWRSGQYVMLGWAAALELLACFAALLIARRRNADLRASIVDPVRGLLGAMESAGRGDLAVEVPASGPLELHQIGVGLRRMTRSLLEQRRAVEATQAEAQRNSAFVELLGTVAAAANEAGTVADALQTVVEEVCAFTGWPVGHAYIRGADGRLLSTDIWHLDDPERFEAFRVASNDPSFDISRGLGAGVLRTGRPQWITHFPERREMPRNHVAEAAGLQTALAFPVILHGEVVGLLEFFSTEHEPVNPESLDMMASVGTQLSHLFEREKSELLLQEANARLSRGIDELEHRNREAGLLNEMGDLLQSCESAEEAYEVVKDISSSLFPGDSGALFLRNPSRTLMEAAVTWGPEAGEHEDFRPDECWGLRRGATYTVHADKAQPTCRHVKTCDTTTVCVPMTAQGEMAGLFHLRLGSQADDAAIARREGIAHQVSERMALALANFRLREKLRRQSIRDPLTDLFNRRYIQETLERETSRALRAGTAMSVIMLDIDHFKRFNDTFGHDAGDAVLKLVAQTLVAAIRTEDIACRYGGEEFLLVLPDATLEQAEGRAEQLRAQVSDLKLVHQGRSLDQVRLSLGVASLPVHGSTWEKVVKAADQALYRAKRGGRDRVMVAHGSTPSQQR
jgi:diguanylate cyclase (GGDEF)-like protein